MSDNALSISCGVLVGFAITMVIGGLSFLAMYGAS